jgi:hypothetical protein
VIYGRDQAAPVRVGSKEYMLLSRNAYEQVRPLLDYISGHTPKPAKPSASTEWTEEKNARRAELINKKYDRGLTAAEKKELKRLQAEVDDFAERALPVRNDILELLLLGLKQAAKTRNR